MADAKWTKGPWVVTATSDLSLFVCQERQHEIIASIDIGRPEDANLIAAAPELYDAVIELQERCSELDEGRPCSIGNAALAKARGETND